FLLDEKVPKNQDCAAYVAVVCQSSSAHPGAVPLRCTSAVCLFSANPTVPARRPAAPCGRMLQGRSCMVCYLFGLYCMVGYLFSLHGLICYLYGWRCMVGHLLGCFL